MGGGPDVPLVHVGTVQERPGFSVCAVFEIAGEGFGIGNYLRIHHRPRKGGQHSQKE